MRFGLQHPIFDFDYMDDDRSQVFDTLKNLITRAESKGFDSFWVMDHFHQLSAVGTPDRPMLEGWTTLSVLAGITTRIKLGTLVTGILYRYPSVLAKIAATMDVLIKGRLFLGIGASYYEGESLAYGITGSGSFPSNQGRLLRLKEAIQIIRKMWTDELLPHSMESIIKLIMLIAILSQFKNRHHLYWLGEEVRGKHSGS